MPCKANTDRRHKIPKTRYRVTNWPIMMRLWSARQSDALSHRGGTRRLACICDRQAGGRITSFGRQCCQEIGAGDRFYAVRVDAMRLIEGILAVAGHEDEWNVSPSQFIGDRV